MSPTSIDMLSFTMSGGALERYEHARTQAGFLSERLQPARQPHLIIVKHTSIAVCRDGGDAGSSISHAARWYHPLSTTGAPARALHELIYLGERPVERDNWFAVASTHVRPDTLRELEWADTKSSFITTLTPGEQAIVGLALSLCAWHSAAHHCPRCGAATSAERDVGFSRYCSRCRRQHFPTIMPAILVAVFDGRGRVLLTQRRRDNPTLTICSGFISHGESAEEALRREVCEETGVVVERMRYVGSQTWPYPYLLMLCYYAVATHASSAVPPVVQESELAAVRWVSKEDVRRAIAGTHPTIRAPSPWTAAYQMLRPWVDGQVSDQGEIVMDITRPKESHL